MCSDRYLDLLGMGNHRVIGNQPLAKMSGPERGFDALEKANQLFLTKFGAEKGFRCQRKRRTAAEAMVAGMNLRALRLRAH